LADWRERLMHGERFHFSSSAVPALAVFYLRGPGVTHTGILHRVGTQLFILDLLWHERLRSGPCEDELPCVVPELEPEEINDVTGICRLIHQRHLERLLTGGFLIPYAFRMGNNTRFSSVTGDLMLGDGLGLTCSTFVLAVFESAKVPLIDLTGWPARADDQARHQELLQMMRNGIPKLVPPADPQHVAAVAVELPCIRVRPEEAAAAGMAETVPASFSKAERGGRWILEVVTPDAQAGWI
jgi:hypothetical protein